ncbi:hypothetical protein C1894_22005 [Pseudomonas sp. FW305-3-2-15-E-TSA2]|nr:hypothetical protein C1895_21235 [Pseudomonas sp. FW305-3-2-15-E-TSA4]POA37923.1 hypothetical protein C1894_22005 [Pseudomonas sp. FW305-3-2-15-E-TSA2]
MAGFLLPVRKVCGLGWPLREQARSHRGSHSKMWERACSRRGPDRHYKIQLYLAFDNRPKPAFPD